MDALASEPESEHGEASLSRIGQGLVSCLQVPELQLANISSQLQSLCLHGNNISRIEGIMQLRLLRELNLSSNCIISTEGLKGLVNLQVLNLASNKLVELSSLEGLKSLSHLNVSYNSLTSIAGLSALQGPECSLRMLNMKHNMLPSLQAFAVLVGCVHLRDLEIAGNPVCQHPSYRQVLLSVLPQIMRLDHLNSAEAMAAPFDTAAAQQLATLRLQAFEPPMHQQPQGMASASGRGTQGGMYQAKHSSSRQSLLDGHPMRREGGGTSPSRRQGGTYLTGSVTANTARLAQAAHEAGAAGGPRTGGNRQQQSISRRGGSASPAKANSLPGHYPPPHQEGGPADMYGRSKLGGPASGRQEQYSHGQYEDGQYGGSAGTGQGQPAPAKIYLRNASVQTAGSDLDLDHPAVVEMLEEGALLKQRVRELTDDLRRVKQAEAEARAQMQQALLASEEGAHQKLEEAYKEASHAVSRALQELESSRASHRAAEEKAASGGRREEDLKLRCESAATDVERLRSQVEQMHDLAVVKSQSAAAAVEEERQRGFAMESSLQQQIAVLRADLSTARATASASEQRIASLDAALQQSSTAAVTMTSKVAQALADSGTQVEGLRSRLAAAEVAAAEFQRRDTESRAEINMLTSSMAAAQTAHQREVEHVRCDAAKELVLAVAREGAAAEERGRAAVMMASQQDKSTLQEQLAYLKAQLQFALRESEKECAGLQEQITRSRADVAELKTALAAAAVRHREHEGLVTEFTSVVQQQKNHIQALQREKEGLQQKLRAYAPEQYDRVAAECRTLRKSVADMDMLKEQVEHWRRMWQDAERRVADLQMSHTRQSEEAFAKCNSLESALAVAREETRKREQQEESLAHKLASSEDAVKVKRAMLDSANDTIASLKAEIQDLQADLDDSRRVLEDLESQLSSAHEQISAEKSGTRSDMESREAAVVQLTAELADTQAKCKEAEARSKASADALTERESMIKYVEEEVDRVKELYGQREARLREERDFARQAAEVAQAAREAASQQLLSVEVKLAAAEARCVEAAANLALVTQDMQVEKSAARVATDAATRSQSEVRRLTQRLAEAESEMRQLLEAVERQKSISATKMQQLASFLKDL